MPSGILWISGDFSEALDHLTEAITLNPKSAILYANRGNCQYINQLYSLVYNLFHRLLYQHSGVHL